MRQPSEPAKPTFRQQLDALFRGPTPAPKQIEVNGSIVTIAELTQRTDATRGDPALQAQELLILDVLADALRRAGQLPSGGELDSAFAEYRKPYDSTPFTTKVIATGFLGYPSLEAFEKRWRIQHAFERTLGKIDRKTLQQEADRWHEFLGDGQVAIELWFYSARDQARQVWDFPAAERRAAAALQALHAGKPAAKPAEASDEIVAVAGWPERPVGYIALRQMMGESDYSDLGQGRSAAAHLFFDAKPGELVGPLRSVGGFWLARVERRIEAKKRFEVDDERSEDLVRSVLVPRRFLEWADSVLAASVLRVPR